VEKQTVLTRSRKPFRWSLLLGGMLAVGLVPAVRVQAQDADQGDSVSSYRTGENTPRNNQPLSEAAQTDPPAKDPKTQGPVRMARFAYVQGNVTWRPDTSASWSKATNNLPLRQGAEIWVTEGGRADVQFDDGSALRLGNGALVVLKVLYSDDKGEFTELALNEGLATLHSRHADAVYQVDTPMASAKTSGDAQIRFGVDGGSEIAVQRGSASIEGSAGKTTLTEGNYLYLRDATAAYTPHRLPGPDSWDRWNSDRNRLIEGKSETYKHVPSNIGLVSEDLDSSGTWHEDAKYGWVWAPRVSSHDWRPYHDGHWVWVDPYGWTWVSDESWGWAPYHYGTWVELSYGWSWCPGSRWQYWSPGVVSFSSYGDRIGWAPLCPWEVRYPSAFSLGYWGGNWGLSFSIGWAGCYYPSYGGYCEGRPFDNYYVNRWNRDNGNYGSGNGYRYRPATGSFDRFHNSAEGQAANSHFVPFNASHGAGATFATNAAFNGRGTYQAGARGDVSLFKSGRTIGAPAGKEVLSGPASIRPTSLARTSTRSFTTDARPSQGAMQRSLYQAPLPTRVQSSLPAPSAQARMGDVTSRANRSSVTYGSPTGRTSAVDSGPSAGRTRTGFSPGSTDHSTTPSGFSGNGANRSAAEAAQQARTSLGMTGGRSGSDFSRGSDRSGVSSGPSGGSERSTGGFRGSSSGGPGYSGSERSYPGNDSTSSPGRSSGRSPRDSGTGGASNTYRVSPGSSYGGSGRSSSGSGGSSGGSSGRSSGSSGSSSGGGRSSSDYGGSSSGGSGRSGGGGGPFNRGR
jgi:hypothetical protein